VKNLHEIKLWRELNNVDFNEGSKKRGIRSLGNISILAVSFIDRLEE
jgi:hypothetical protein